MHLRLRHVQLALLTALGLDLGCAVAVDPPADDGETGEDSSSDASTTSETGETGETGEPPGVECLDPVVILQSASDVSTGFVECLGGFIHREQPVECVNPPRTDDMGCSSEFDECTTGADCGDAPYAACVFVEGSGCECQIGCMADSDCPDGTICGCAGLPGVYDNTCIPAGCADADDCDEGGLCGLSTIWDGCDKYISRTACAYPDSECLVDADCEDPLICSAWGAPGFTCEEEDGSVCGRPFVVAGEARVARACTRADWAPALRVELELDADTRTKLAAYWTRIASFEHASVASFARFTLDLLQLGAPPTLLREAQRAAVDEIEHARSAFALASAYAGRSLGPDRLELGAATPRVVALRTIVAGLIEEACVEETLAAIEAGEAAVHARDPQLARTLEQIADDELRHAQLGWRTLSWILGRSDVDADLRRFALEHLRACLREAAERPCARGFGIELRSHGLLDDERRASLRATAVRSVLSPLAEQLAEVTPVHLGA